MSEAIHATPIGPYGSETHTFSQVCRIEIDKLNRQTNKPAPPNALMYHTPLLSKGAHLKLISMEVRGETYVFYGRYYVNSSHGGETFTVLGYLYRTPTGEAMNRHTTHETADLTEANLIELRGIYSKIKHGNDEVTVVKEAYERPVYFMPSLVGFVWFVFCQAISLPVFTLVSYKLLSVVWIACSSAAFVAFDYLTYWIAHGCRPPARKVWGICMAEMEKRAHTYLVFWVMDFVIYYVMSMDIKTPIYMLVEAVVVVGMELFMVDDVYYG